jgi:hypothetical protein
LAKHTNSTLSSDAMAIGVTVASQNAGRGFSCSISHHTEAFLAGVLPGYSGKASGGRAAKYTNLAFTPHPMAGVISAADAGRILVLRGPNHAEPLAHVGALHTGETDGR